MTHRLAVAGLSLLLVSGCSVPRDVVVLIPDESGNVGRAVVSANGATVELDHAFDTAAIDPAHVAEKIPSVTPAQADTEFAAALAATPRQPVTFRVFFANAGIDLDSRARAVLSKVIATAKATPAADISVVGYTDAIGHSAAANSPLSRRRAEAVTKVLIANGLPPDRVEITFFGSESPAVPNAPGIPEPLNRRVEITLR